MEHISCAAGGAQRHIKRTAEPAGSDRRHKERSTAARSRCRRPVRRLPPSWDRARRSYKGQGIGLDTQTAHPANDALVVALLVRHSDHHDRSGSTVHQASSGSSLDTPAARPVPPSLHPQRRGRSLRLALRHSAHRQTHTQTDRQTDRQPSRRTAPEAARPPSIRVDIDAGGSRRWRSVAAQTHCQGGPHARATAARPASGRADTRPAAQTSGLGGAARREGVG